MSDTLAIAVSQSGTTTDTNRTVDLLRGRGAAVIGIVNRRGSDLTDKADGVLYTSDGRDVEMSVASTKAFYAQVAAGALLSCAIAEAAGLGDPARRSRSCSPSLRELPDAMREVLAAPRPRSPKRPGDSRRRGGTGRSSATAPTRSPPRRCGSSSASSATSRSPATHRGQEAHRPVVRAADPGVRRRARRARPPTTSPRRWRSSAPTRRRRS